MKALKFFFLFPVLAAVLIKYPIYSSAEEPDIFLYTDVSDGDVSGGDVSGGDVSGGDIKTEPEKPSVNPDNNKKTEYETIMEQIRALYKLAKKYIDEKKVKNRCR